MKFKRTTPCSNCPFKTNTLKGWLGKERIKDISNTVLNDGGFTCHKDNAKRNKERNFCAGALKYIQNVTGDVKSNVLPRLAIMYGDFDETMLKGDCFTSEAELIKHHNNERLQ